MSLLLLFLTLFSFAQIEEKNYQYQMDGSFKATLPGLSESQNVNYSVLWNEKAGTISGVYRDNFFSSNSPVTGTSGASGRVYHTTFSRALQNVMKISITTVATNLDAGTMPLMIFLKDRVEMTLDQITTSAKVTVRTDYVPETDSCDAGFGEVKGFCGLYKGTFTELSDSANLCSLPDYGFKMELSKEARVTLYFYHSQFTIGIPTHNLGAFETVPLSPSFTISERHCGNLVGTSFPNSNCQTLRLSGSFSKLNDKNRFNGIYSIQDDVTKESCRYSLILEAED